MPSEAEHRNAILGAMFAAGAAAVHEEGLWFVTHCETDSKADAIVAAALVVDPGALAERTQIPVVDWSVKWRDGVCAHTVGALEIAPPWLATGRDPSRTIVIEPAMAFGTGDHATTRGVLHLMQSVVRPGDAVADLGCGSAVLAIAAARLGARRVAAIELDPDAIANAEANVVRNGVGDRVAVLEGDASVLLPLVAPVRVVLANIISSVIESLLPAIRDSLSDAGVAIFSGMLMTERITMRAVFRAGGWDELAEHAEGEWWTVSVRRRLP